MASKKLCTDTVAREWSETRERIIARTEAALSDSTVEKSPDEIDCDRCYQDPHGPSHNGSRLCRNKASIASGGTYSHCTCAACF